MWTQSFKYNTNWVTPIKHAFFIAPKRMLQCCKLNTKVNKIEGD